MPIANLPSRLQGLRLVQLSDFHFDGVRLSKSLLKEAIAASNAANADLILLTGDFVTDEPETIHRLVPWLKDLQSRHGVYAILGNHDNRYRRSRHEITQALETAGVQVLWNQIAYPIGAELPLVGLADFWSADFNPAAILAEIDPQLPRLVLSHNPDSAEVLQTWRIDLQLSGHTHGGQVVLPGFGSIPKFLATVYVSAPQPLRRCLSLLKSFHYTAKHWEWSEGLHQVGQNQLYVNRGLGTYLPGRLFCPPEVTVITLV